MNKKCTVSMVLGLVAAALMIILVLIYNSSRDMLTKIFEEVANDPEVSGADVEAAVMLVDSFLKTIIAIIIVMMVITAALAVLSFWFKQTWIPMLVVGILTILIGGVISGILTIVGAVKRKNFDKTLYQTQPNYYYNNGDGNYNNNNGNNNGADMNNVQ